MFVGESRNHHPPEIHALCHCLLCYVIVYYLVFTKLLLSVFVGESGNHHPADLLAIVYYAFVYFSIIY